MEGKQGQWGASDWFASWLGQCYKGQPIEGELKFAETKTEKKASENLQGPFTPVGASSVVSRGSGEALKSDCTTKRYLIDNSVLQTNRPSVAFRYSKDKSKKVKEMKAASWGEIVDGIDEGDGWLRVGLHYLPMVRRGKPIITLVKDPELPTKAKQDKGVADGGVRSDLAATSPKKDVVAEPEKLVTRAAQESASSPEENVIAEPEKASADLADVAASRPKKDVLLTEPEKPQAPEEGVLRAGTGVGELKKPASFAEDEDVDALVKPAEQPQRAWFAHPSVGTWLHALPQVVEKNAECSVVEDHPIQVEVPPVKWEHCPSVGTWAHRRPIGLAPCSRVADATLDDLLQ